MKEPQAFPTSGYEKGMTLRDWFAGQALAGLCSQSFTVPTHSVNDVVARGCYRVADSMMYEREHRNDTEEAAKHD